MEYYWLIEKWNGEKIRVKPTSAPYVQKIIAKGEGFITTSSMTINVKDIKSFDRSDIPFDDQKLLEGASRAFNEPVILPNGSVEAKWVKKTISRRHWDKYYSGMPSYHLIGEDEGSVTVAFQLPTHLIKPKVVTQLSNYEVANHGLNRHFD